MFFSFASTQIYTPPKQSLIRLISNKMYTEQKTDIVQEYQEATTCADLQSLCHWFGANSHTSHILLLFLFITCLSTQLFNGAFY